MLGWKSNCIGKDRLPRLTVSLPVARVNTPGGVSRLEDMANLVATGKFLSPILGTRSNLRAVRNWPCASVNASPTYAGSIEPDVLATTAQFAGRMCELDIAMNTSMSTLPMLQTVSVTL
jgi:hypothetical protein